MARADYKFEYKGSFKDKAMVFATDKITFSNDGESYNVMMDWEKPIMKQSAEFVTHGGRAQTILELGFGMGLSANFIQEYSPDLHTIIEYHPGIAARAQAFADERNKAYSRDKETQHKRVNIISGKDWFAEFQKDFEKSGLIQYHGIFIDTYNDQNLSKIKDYIIKLLSPGGRMTWWNPMQDILPSEELQEERNITYQTIKLSEFGIKSIPTNKYHTTDIYYMPMYTREGKKEIYTPKPVEGGYTPAPGIGDGPGVIGKK